MIILPTYSPCLIENGVLRIDRKFHVGASVYAERLGTSVVVIAPTLTAGCRQMDFVEIPTDDLSYRVEPVRCDGNHRLRGSELDRVERLVGQASLIYGTGFETQLFAQKLAKPYIAVVEYDLPTQIKIARFPVHGRIRRGVRTVKTLCRFLPKIRDLRRAHSVHCNGYPVHEQSRRFHRDCLLYLDSRMADAMVIESDRLDMRLADFKIGRKPRLLYSGRYEEIKGALDVVEVGLELFRRKVPFVLDLFGAGSLVGEMRRRVESAGAQDCIHVNNAIPYPELVERSHDSDVFICCHVQADPSCTYLEACGSGLPIVGYGNRMWRSFVKDAGNGLVTRMGRPVETAKAVQNLLSDWPSLSAFAHRSRDFAKKHCFEGEFDKRIHAIQELLRTL